MKSKINQNSSEGFISSAELEEFKRVGHVSDAHGLHGDLLILSPSKEYAWAGELEEVILVSKDIQKKFSVEKSSLHKHFLRLKLGGIEDRTQAEAYKKSDFYIPKDLMISEDGETIYLEEILNFSVQSPSGEALGTVEDFSSNSVQDLLIVRNQRGQFEIPFVEDFIIDIDFEKKSMVLDLPQGLMGEVVDDEQDGQEDDE